MALNVRNVPRSLVAKCKAKAALEQKTLEEFVRGLLKRATADVTEPKPKYPPNS